MHFITTNYLPMQSRLKHLQATYPCTPEANLCDYMQPHQMGRNCASFCAFINVCDVPLRAKAFFPLLRALAKNCSSISAQLLSTVNHQQKPSPSNNKEHHVWLVPSHRAAKPTGSTNQYPPKSSRRKAFTELVHFFLPTFMLMEYVNYEYTHMLQYYIRTVRVERCFGFDLAFCLPLTESSRFPLNEKANKSFPVPPPAGRRQTGTSCITLVSADDVAFSHSRFSDGHHEWFWGGMQMVFA